MFATEDTRRGFLGTVAGIAGLSAVSGRLDAEINNEALGFKLGVASYSLRSFSRADAIKMIVELKTPFVSVKDVHLKLGSSQAEIEAGVKEFADAGLKIMSGGNISLKKEEQIKPAFEYAKMA